MSIVAPSTSKRDRGFSRGFFCCCFPFLLLMLLLFCHYVFVIIATVIIVMIVVVVFYPQFIRIIITCDIFATITVKKSVSLISSTLHNGFIKSGHTKSLFLTINIVTTIVAEMFLLFSLIITVILFLIISLLLPFLISP